MDCLIDMEQNLALMQNTKDLSVLSKRITWADLLLCWFLDKSPQFTVRTQDTGAGREGNMMPIRRPLYSRDKDGLDRR